MSGVENEYIIYCEQKTNEVRCYYADRMSQLKLHTVVQHYQPKGTLGKQRGSTLSQPVELEG